MNKNSFGSIASLFVIFCIAALAVGVIGGLALVAKNQQCEQVGNSIKKCESNTAQLEKRNRELDQILRQFTEQISLQKIAETRAGSLRRLDPNSGQIMFVQRGSAITPADKIYISEPTRRSILEIAFMTPPTEQERPRK